MKFSPSTASAKPRRAPQTVVYTPDGRPDLVVTRIWSESNEVGKPTNFRATIKNVGDGPTPLNTTSGVTFFINGQYTSFGGTGALQPGEEATIAPDGGNLKWAPDKAGSYSVKAQADDINRVSGEKSESNNWSEWTLAVGQNADAKLSLEGGEGPFAAKLSDEGALDWVAFGLAGGDGAKAKTEVNRKPNTHLIGDLTEVRPRLSGDDLGFAGSRELVWRRAHRAKRRQQRWFVVERRGSRHRVFRSRKRLRAHFETLRVGHQRRARQIGSTSQRQRRAPM